MADPRSVPLDDPEPEARQTLIVMEPGAGWPARSAGAATEWAVARQDETEPDAEFLWRTNHLIREMAVAGRPIDLAILSCNRDTRERRLACRKALGHSLLAALQPSRAAQLVLLGDASGGPTARRALWTLVGELMSTLGDAKASISVVFDDATPAIGVPVHAAHAMRAGGRIAPRPSARAAAPRAHCGARPLLRALP
jgi:hypothetical protein